MAKRKFERNRREILYRGRTNRVGSAGIEADIRDEIASRLNHESLAFDDSELHRVRMSLQEQKRPEFLEISPWGVVPASVDTDEADLAIIESGAILIHLAGKTGRLLPTELRQRSQVIQWLMFHTANIGPTQSSADPLTIGTCEWVGLSLDAFPNLERWLSSMAKRPACRRGLNLPIPLEPEKMPAGYEKYRRYIETVRSMLDR